MTPAAVNIGSALATLQDQLPIVATFTTSDTPLQCGNILAFYKRIDTYYKGGHHALYVKGGILYDIYGPMFRYWDCNYGLYPLLGVATAIFCRHVHWRQDKGRAIIGGDKFTSAQEVIDAFG